MVEFSVFDLWLPIVVAGLAVHFASTLAWMVLPHHRPEWKSLENPRELAEWLKAHGVAPGQYLFPNQGQESGGEFPLYGTLRVWNRPVNMGAAIGKTLAFFFAAVFTIAYLASMGLSPAAEPMLIFRFVFVAAMLTFCAARYPGSFWFQQKTLMDLLDGLVFAAITAGVFVWFWPAAAP